MMSRLTSQFPTTAACLLAGALLFVGGCSESEAEVQARKVIAQEQARLNVVASTAKAIRGAAAASTKEAAAHAKAFDYKALSAPVGSQLSLYRTPEGVSAKPGVALFKGNGDFSVALKAMSRLSPVGDALIVEGIQATDTAFAATLGYARPAAPPATAPCARLRNKNLDDIAVENEDIAKLLAAARTQCDSLADVFSTVDLNKKNQRDRDARNDVERAKAMKPLFSTLSSLVVGKGEVFRFPTHITIKGCTKESLDTAGLRAALLSAELSPRLQKSALAVTVTECLFSMKIDAPPPATRPSPSAPSVGGAP